MLTGTTGQLMLSSFKNTADGATKLMQQLQDNKDLDMISRGQALWDGVSNQGGDIYKSQLGVNAYGAKDRASDFYDTKGRPEGGKVSNEAAEFNRAYDDMSQFQKSSVDRYMQNRRAPFVGSIADHEISQRTASTKASKDLRIESSIETAALNFNDEQIIFQELSKIHALHRELGPAAGLDSNGIAFAVAKDSAKLHQEVVKRRLSVQDPEGAQRYLDDVTAANALLPTQISKIQSLVNAGVRAGVKAQNEADKLEEKEYETQQDASFLFLSGKMQDGTLNYDTLQSFAENDSITIQDFKHFERLLKAEEDSPRESTEKVYTDMRQAILNGKSPGYAEIYRNQSLSLGDQDKLADMTKKMGDKSTSETMSRARRIMGSSFGFPQDSLDDTSRQRRAAAEHEFDVEVFVKGRDPVEVANELAESALGNATIPGGARSQAQVRMNIRDVPEANRVFNETGVPDVKAMTASASADIKIGKIPLKDVPKINNALKAIKELLPPPVVKPPPPPAIDKPTPFFDWRGTLDDAMELLGGDKAAPAQQPKAVPEPEAPAAEEVPLTEVVPDNPEEEAPLELGEWTGRYNSEGRKIYPNNFGTESSEYTIGVTNKQINEGQLTHIPSIYNGKPVSQKEAEDIIIANGGKDPETGRLITPGGDPEARSQSLVPANELEAEGTTEEGIRAKAEETSQRVAGVGGKIVNALIRVESGFDNSAVSEKGATGLMQIMPGTADGIAEATGLDRDKIFTDPATNIEAGTWLFYNDIFPRYNGVNKDDQFKFALAEWNSSPNAIEAARKKAKDRNEFDDIFEFLPDETKEFLGKMVKELAREDK
tara:strand:+ start:3615 stop:6095 length:2481 start_codon:yes stop_codon:yes gene_type:complete